MSFFTGSPEKHKRISTLRREQEPLYQQLQAATRGRGAGGAFGTAADYYRDLLDPNSQTAQQMMAPEMRQFNEEIVPGLANQFAGFGAGGSGLMGSDFRNASINAGTDLSERLGAIRARLREQGAAGLAGLGQQGLGNFSQDVVTRQGSPGFLSQVAPIIGGALGSFAGPLGTMAGTAFGNMASNWLSSKRHSLQDTYGSGIAAGPESGGMTYNPYTGNMR